MMNQKNREPGFYWVVHRGKKQIAEWSHDYDGVWLLTGSDEIFWDSEMEKIDESRIVREEQKS